MTSAWKNLLAHIPVIEAGKIQGFAGMIILLLVFSIGSGDALAADEKTDAQKSLERRQKVELLSFFLKDPSEAEVPTTPMSVELYNKAVGHMRKSEYDLAKDALLEAIALDEENALAYELLGDIEYLQQNMASAKENYQVAYNLQPSKDLKEKISKLRKETKIERSLSTYREKNFIIKYHDSEQNYEGFELRELLRNVYRDISEDFAYYFNHKVVVLLYDYADYRKISEAPHWVAGFYDGKVRMPINARGYTDTQLRALTAHEVTHAFVAAMSEMKAPIWIHEGLAQYEENKVKPLDMSVFESAVSSGRLFPLMQIMSQGSVMQLRDPVSVTLFYRQVFHLISFLEDRYGMFRIKKILEAFAAGKNSDEAIRSVLRISVDRLEREWKETL